MSKQPVDLFASSSGLLQVGLFLATAALHRTFAIKQQQAHENTEHEIDSESDPQSYKFQEIKQKSGSNSNTVASTTSTEDLNLYAWRRMRHRLSFDAGSDSASEVFAQTQKGIDAPNGQHHHHFEESIQEGRKRCFETTYSKLILQNEEIGVQKRLSNISRHDNTLNRPIPPSSCRGLIDHDNMEPRSRRRSQVQKNMNQQHSFNSVSESSSATGEDVDEEECLEDFGFDAASVYTTRRSSLSSFVSHGLDIGENLNDPSRTSPPPTFVPRSSSLSSCRKSFQKARSDYNSRIMPNRVIMVRHGQSEGNIDEHIYTKKPDNLIQLTTLGWKQARMAGRVLRNQILERSKSRSNSTEGCDQSQLNASTSRLESVHFIVSPYVRTMETFHGMLSAWCDPDIEFGHVDDMEMRKIMWYDRLKTMGVSWHEDPRIREQDFGNYQDTNTIRKAKSERHKFGVFYYRFPNGEAASDVFERVSTFLDSLWRSFDVNRSDNYVLVTHGISIRVLLARYFRYSIDQFNMLANPRNAEMILLAHDGQGKLQVEGRCELELEETKQYNGEIREISNIDVTGFRFYRKLSIVPKHHMRSRTIRLSDK